MKNSKIISTIVISFSLLLTTSCENSAGHQTPESATIIGTITFTGTTWPTNGYISLSLISAWMGTEAPAANAQILAEDLSNNSYQYTISNVTFGTYGAIAVSWQDPNDSNPATNQHVLGAYGGIYPFASSYGGTDPTPITVSATQYELTGIDFSADLKYIDACSKQTTDSDCNALDHCTWYAEGSMGPGTTAACY